MKLDNDPVLVARLRESRAGGTRAVDLLRILAERGLGTVEIMSHLREAFTLNFDDVSCIGGWFPDGTGELSDDAIDALLESSLRSAPGGRR